MIKVIGYILIIMVLPAVTFAAELFGYYEGQYFGFVLDDDFNQMQSNKLRVDLQYRPSNKVLFAANFDFLNYNGKTEFNIIDYLPDRVAVEVPPENYEYYGMTYSDSIFLDNAFVKMNLDKLDLTIGKQQISYGTGYAYNPTDIFNIKDVLDPTYEQPGHNAIRLDIPLFSRNSLMGVYSPGDDWKNSIKMVRFKVGIGHFDFSFTGIQFNWKRTDYFELTEYRRKRTLVGFDLVGEALGLGIWTEFAHNFMQSMGDFSELVIGSDYTFKGGFYIMGEYYYNGLGKENPKDYTFNDWMKFYAGEKRSVAEHNLFIYGDYPITDFIRIGSSIIVSISDKSGAIVPQFSYNIFQDIDLTVFGNIYGGKSGGAYAEDSGSGILARIRVYF